MAAWDKDLLGRREVADFLQNLLESDDEIKVINIDSPWGTGKTFFLANWRQQLEEDRGVVYFNAWEKDYTGDPFISLVAAIKDQLEKQIGKSVKQRKIVKDFKDKASQTFFATAPIMVKLLGKGVFKKISGVDVDEMNEEVSSALDKASEIAIQSIIESSKNDEKIVEGFEVTLKALVSEVSRVKAKDKEKPVYILIDELDRCRPTYAIELLERVKHFFSVEGCKFIIATDTGQLLHSVKAVYGSGFDSKEYLRRFFDLDYTFKSSECLSWVVSNFNLDPEGPYYFSGVKAKRDPDGYYRDVSMRKQWVFPDLESVVSSDELDLDLPQIFFAALSITFRVSLRGMERNKKHIMASLANIGSKNIHIFFLMYLVFLKNADDELYSCFVRSDMRSGDLAKEIKQKYAPRKVYFPFANVDVHSLAVVYRDLVFAFKWEDGKEAPQSKYELVEQVFRDRRESVNSLNYDRVIGLASRID